MAKPKSIEEVIDKIKWYDHTTKAMFGKTVLKREFFSESEMSKVTVPGKTVIPLNSVIHINGKMSSQIENYFIEPDSDIPVMIPMHMYANQTNPRLCLVNASDRYYTIRKDTVVGEAVSADPVELYQKAQQDDRGESTALTPSLELLVDKAGKQLANDHKEALKKL